MKNVIVITGAASGFGALAARALAQAGHTVYASMRETNTRNAAQVEAAKKYASDNNVDLRTVELDVASQESADKAIQQIVADNGRLDVVIHNAGHMVFGPAEAFTPRTTGAPLRCKCSKHSARQSLRPSPVTQTEERPGCLGIQQQLCWRTPPYLAPYFAAKAAMDALAVVYARELTRWGIENLHNRPGRIHRWHQSFRQFGPSRGSGTRRRV
jgi:NAD(P)-dependent dehydrogenase (short-subunit alcohol dehydrogenase family)